MADSEFNMSFLCYKVPYLTVEYFLQLLSMFAKFFLAIYGHS